MAIQPDVYPGRKTTRDPGRPRGKKQFRTRGRCRGRVYKIRGICTGFPLLGPPLLTSSGTLNFVIFRNYCDVLDCIIDEFSFGSFHIAALCVRQSSGKERCSLALVNCLEFIFIVRRQNTSIQWRY